MLWDVRHVALTSQFANSASAWLTKKSGSHDWSMPSREAQKSIECSAWRLAKQQEDDRVVAGVLEKAEPLRIEFEVLAKRWQRDTRHLSQISKKITHSAFLRIIGMGEAAIPLILESLREKPAHWFTALRAISNTDPAKPDDTPSQAGEAWIAWGISRRYIDRG